MIMLTKEQLADLLRESFKLGACIGVVTHKSWIDSEPFHHAREHAIQPLVHRSSGAHGDAERFVWMIEKAQTGSIGFGEFVLYPGDAVNDVRAVIDYAMAAAPKDVGAHDDHRREVVAADQVHEKFRERSNHHVVRGHESQPCWCWADSDHRIGEEVRQKDAQGGDKP